MLKTLFLLFVLYMLYKLVFDFIIPVYTASKRMRDQVQQAQQKMQEEQHRRQFERDGYVPASDAQKSTTNRSTDKDYIEFEEVK